MSFFYLYSDEETLATLKNTQQKVILPGGDFGFSNFGDVLQLKGTIAFYKQNSSFSPIPVFDLFAISNVHYIAEMKQRFGVDGILFVSDREMDFTESKLDLFLVKEVHNCDLCHLYGGGFLNSRWGEHTLNVTEWILKRFNISNYIISGQQVELSFIKKIKAHVEQFKPILVGARDHDSLANLQNEGIDSIYTFDDATEELLKISRLIPSEKCKKILGHINLSNYTDSSKNKKEIIHNFALLKNTYPDHNLILFNAFNDNRFEVCDTLRSIVELENKFPYKSYAVVDGAALAYSGEVNDISLLAAEVAISSSYHTTLLMHLAGTPCWLVSNNSYYDQKRSSLSVDGALEDFLKNPTIPNYEKKLSARREWCLLLLKCVKNFQTSSTHLVLNYPPPRENAMFFLKTNGIHEKDLWIKELQEAKEWLDSQYRMLITQLAAKKHDIKELQDSKDWHDSQLRILILQLVAKEHDITELQESKELLAMEINNLKDNLIYKILNKFKLL